jgi:hypothetical protein
MTAHPCVAPGCGSCAMTPKIKLYETTRPVLATSFKLNECIFLIMPKMNQIIFCPSPCRQVKKKSTFLCVKSAHFKRGSARTPTKPAGAKFFLGDFLA